MKEVGRFKSSYHESSRQEIVKSMEFMFYANRLIHTTVMNEKRINIENNYSSVRNASELRF